MLTLQLAIEQSIPSRSVQTVLKTTPFSERTNKFLERSENWSRVLGHSYVGTEHLLLSAVTEENSLMNAYFKKAGISADSVKKTVAEIQKKIPSSYNTQSENQSSSSRSNEDPVPFMSDGRIQQKKSNQKNTSLLSQFSRDLTLEARNEKMDPVIGRDKEVAVMVRTLCRRTKNCLLYTSPSPRD